MAIDSTKVDTDTAVGWLNAVEKEKGQAYACAVSDISVKRAEIWEAKAAGKDMTIAEMKLSMAITLFAMGQSGSDPEKAKEYAVSLLNDSDKLVEMGEVALTKYRKEYGGLEEDDVGGVGYGGTA